MATWTTISNAAVAVGGIPSSTTVTALRDNPVAIAESSTGAPVVASTWHPYNKVTVGDGQTGLIYDFSINGTVANVITPDFEDGYEYRIIMHELSSNSASTVRLDVEAFFSVDAVYRRLIYSGDSAASTRYGGDVWFSLPRVSKLNQSIYGDLFANNTYAMGYDLPYDTTMQKLSRARIKFTTGSIINGRIWFLRRREYISLP